MSLWPYVRPGTTGRELLAWRLERASAPGTLWSALVADGVMLPLEPATLAIRQLALRKDRFVLLLEGAAPDGAVARFIAKGYADDRAGRLDGNHRLLWEGGLGDRAATVRTNEPIAVSPSLGLAISEWLPGVHPAPSDVEGAARSGAAAARLHGTGAPLEPAFTVAAFLDNVARHVRRLKRRAPELRPASKAAGRALEAAAPTIRFELSAPLNGDLSLGSFLLADERVYLIDWDNSCRFDPAWDVGHYVTQLVRFGAERGEESAGSREAFLRSYEAVSGDRLGPDWSRRLAFFEAAACLHKTYAAARVGRDGWEGVAAHLVERALALAAPLAPATE
ncbi:MAG: hypothetical protein RL338_1089 [Chloroflexota bacterium]